MDEHDSELYVQFETLASHAGLGMRVGDTMATVAPIVASTTLHMTRSKACIMPWNRVGRICILAQCESYRCSSGSSACSVRRRG
jgi:hypothetical protein